MLLVSLVIAFFIWVAVAMYASPEESYTIYNIPITVNTENSLVSQKGYKNFWQSDEAIDVTVTGPRYLITSLTPDDIIVSANLNTVDSSGVSQLALRVGLRQESQDITISQQSKTHVDIYFDAELEKERKILSAIDLGSFVIGFTFRDVSVIFIIIMALGPFFRTLAKITEEKAKYLENRPEGL